MVISVASGKGGTGKTTVAVNLALSLKDAGGKVQLLDADVQEPNAHIFLKPRFYETLQASIPVPEIQPGKCTLCRRCAEVCAFNAMAVLGDSVMVFPELCHGCGGCSLFCPEGAIVEVPRVVGIVQRGTAHGMEFIQGRLNPGEAISPPVIREAKKYIDPGASCVIDAAPGTSCPVVEAVKGSDYCLLVTEPTPFGHNDLVLAVTITRKMGIPVGIVLNRCGVGDTRVEDYCRAEGLPILMRIPFSRQAAEAYAAGLPVSLAVPGWEHRFSSLARDVLREVRERAGQ